MVTFNSWTDTRHILAAQILTSPDFTFSDLENDER